MATVDFHGSTVVGLSIGAASLVLVDDTTNDVSTARHGFAPKAPNDATKFLNGVGAYAVPPGTAPVSSVFGRTGAVVAATNDYSEAQLSFTDITTNDVSTSKHGFAPKAPNDATKFLDGTAAYDTVKDSDLSTSDITTNDVSTSKHGFAPKLPNDSTKFLNGVGAYAVPATSGGIGAVLFDSTLVADTASIDTGAGGIAAGHSVLYVWMILRTDDAGATSTVNITLNNDTGANYDFVFTATVNATVSGNNSLAQTSWALGAHGSGGTAGYASEIELVLPGYDGTTFNKIGRLHQMRLDSTAANVNTNAVAVGYRSTSAVSRLKVAAAGAAKLKTGSRLLILGGV